METYDLMRHFMCDDLTLSLYMNGENPDFEEIEDTPTYQDPKRPCRGIKRVYVNGVLTAIEGTHTGARAGQVLRKGKI